MNARIATSDKVTAKAATLPVQYRGYGRFAVASGSEPGKVYQVQAASDTGAIEEWNCDCEWGQNGGRQCSHVRAAVRHAVTEIERSRRQASRRAVAA